MNKLVLPIILGTDINAYTMSVSFYEKYQIKPVLVGQIPMAYTKGSTIIKQIRYINNIEDNDIFLNALNEVHVKYKDQFEHLLLRSEERRVGKGCRCRWST